MDPSSFPSPLGPIALALALLPVALGCADAPSPDPVRDGPTHAEASLPAPSAQATAPMAGLTPPPPGDERFVGVVRESLPAGGYTYMRLNTSGGPRWIVSMGAEVPVGTLVEIENMGTQANFHSRRLDRSFDALAFAVVHPRTDEGEV